MLSAEVTSRLLGIEIETVIPIVGQGENFDIQQLVADILTRQGIRSAARNYSHSPVPEGHDLCVEYDSSLRDETKFQGIKWARLEIKNRPMTFAEVERILPLTLEVLQYLGCRVNASTSLHNHIDARREVANRPEVARNIAHLCFRYQNVLMGLVAASRRNNHYCQAMTAADAKRFDRVRSYEDLCREVGHCERFKTVNFTNLNQRGTVEFRLHNGTLDWSKIRSWILLNQRIVEHACRRNCHYGEPIENSRAALNSLLVCVGLKSNSRIYTEVQKELRETGRWLVKRWKHFNCPRDCKSGDQSENKRMIA